MKRGDVAKFLGKERTTVKYYQKKGYLKAKKKGQAFFYDPDEVLEFALNPPKGVIFYIGADASEIIHRLKLYLREGNLPKTKEDLPKYTRRRLLEVNEGYEFLQYFGLIRIHITRKYEITARELELLLYLTPLNYFTELDIIRFPAGYTYRTAKSLIKKGFIVPVTMPPAKRKSRQQLMKTIIYTLSKEKRDVVVELYELLSRERPLTGEEETLKKDNAHDMKRLRLIKKMNQLPADKLKPLYED